jgi:hypothetical protein
MLMSINALNVTSPACARYWSELKGLSDKEKIELIDLLSSSLTNANEQPASHKTDWTAKFAGKWKDDQNERLDAALARFHGDWGGDKAPIEIAKELRQGPEMVRDVETW